MSGLVNKVKEALSSAHDTPTEERSGKLNLTPEERERLEAAGYGAEHHAEKRHLGATEDITQAPGGHPPSYYLNQQSTASSALPGSFPESQQDNVGSQQHKDGREYVAPKGTHVGSATATPQKATDSTLTQPVTDSTYSNVPGHLQGSGTETRTADTTAAGAGAAAVAGAGTGAIAAHETKSGPNKLHKKEDPRGHVGFQTPPSHEAIHGTQATTTTTAVPPTTTAAATVIPTTTGSTQHTTPATRDETTTAVHHSIGGTHHTPATKQTGDLYDQQASRKYDGNIDNTANTPNYSYPTGGATSTAVAAGGLASTQLPDRTHHDERSAIDSQNATSTTGHRHVSGTVYNTVTGAGSHDDPTTHAHGTTGLGGSLTNPNQTFSSHAGLTTGSSALPRDAGDPTITSAHPTASNTTSSLTPLPATLTGASTTSTTTSQGGVGGAGQHYGPGTIGAKVLHTCTKCGEDNDITHYFKKESVYRLSQ